jgi:hypothetical protein
MGHVHRSNPTVAFPSLFIIINQSIIIIINLVSFMLWFLFLFVSYVCLRQRFFSFLHGWH